MHKPVLLQEVIDGLEIKDNETIVDATLGGAGHSIAILQTSARNLTLIGIDADATATHAAKEKLAPYNKTHHNASHHSTSHLNASHHIIIENSYFDSLGEILDKHHITHIDKILFDLGFRSDQVDSPDRGMSFQQKGPLDMRYGDDAVATAEEVVNDWSEETLADIIYGFGEEKFARRIARAISEKRTEHKISTTTELAEIVRQAVPAFYRRGRLHPATKTFQAIRIAVNSELDRLKQVLPIAFDRLRPASENQTGGRIAVISFHSLEDRIVKNFFRDKKNQNQARLLTKKPITPSRDETKNNPRARSAKLRIIEKNK